jgi:bifunctional non-homologous end joining protein LigD
MSRVSSLSFIEPQLPSLVDQPPEGAEWLHEVKHDGYRTLLAVQRGSVVAYTRNGFDWTDRYQRIVEAAARLRCKSAMLDGEVIVQDRRGASDFEALQAALRSKRTPLIFYAFDLLHLEGKDYRNLPLVERRAKLKLLVGSSPNAIQFSEEFVGDAEAFFRACRNHQLEGMVSKLANSPYRSGRSRTWLKTKCFIESDFILLGIDRDRKTRAPRALLAKTEGGHLEYAGAAFFALTGDAREELASQIEALTQERPCISWLRNRGARWVRPEVTLRVRHLAGPRLLRHATVREIAECVREGRRR